MDDRDRQMGMLGKFMLLDISRSPEHSLGHFSSRRLSRNTRKSTPQYFSPIPILPFRQIFNFLRKLAFPTGKPYRQKPDMLTIISSVIHVPEYIFELSAKSVVADEPDGLNSLH